MPKVVFDTVGFVRALINPRSRWGRLVFDYSDHYVLIVSEPLVLEVLEVIRRPELVKVFGTLPYREPATIVRILQTASAVDTRVDMPIVGLRDPNDLHVLATAIAGQADYLVTEDRDLLDLNHIDELMICTAARFLADLEQMDE